MFIKHYKKKLQTLNGTGIVDKSFFNLFSNPDGTYRLCTPTHFNIYIIFLLFIRGDHVPKYKYKFHYYCCCHTYYVCLCAMCVLWYMFGLYHVCENFFFNRNFLIFQFFFSLTIDIIHITATTSTKHPSRSTYTKNDKNTEVKKTKINFEIKMFIQIKFYYLLLKSDYSRTTQTYNYSIHHIYMMMMMVHTMLQ